MAATPANGITIGWQLIGIVVAGIVGYFSAEIRTQATISSLTSDISNIRSDVEHLDEWSKATSNNRFTNLDGQRLRDYVDDRFQTAQDRLDLHINQPAHSDVLPRLTSVEVRLSEIERTHRSMRVPEE